jgi:hypothetical protein
VRVVDTQAADAARMTTACRVRLTTNGSAMEARC